MHIKSYYHKKETKIFLRFLALFFAVFLILFYTRGNLLHLVNDTSTATTTPKETKPKPKPQTELGIGIFPKVVMQGEPVMIIAHGVASTTSVKSFTLDGRPLVIFSYEGQVGALYGADLHGPTGKFPLILTLKDGRVIKKDLVINKRPDVRRPFDIPEKLGGNTPESIKILFSTLAQEGKIINALPTGTEKLWTESFGSPLKDGLVVDDPYGYTRTTLNVSMPHKGVDLVASIGTPVYSMNNGKVEFADNLRNYGNVVVVDHGLGLQTVYVHLSEIKVTKGQMVKKGELLGLSGDTGYTLNPHLHLTVRIWDISIDPLKFLEILGE